MKLAVIGAGLMGRAALFDFGRIEEVEKVGIYDIDEDLAAQIGKTYGNDKQVTGKLDASDEDAAAEILSEYDAAISCVTYKYNPGLTKAAIKAKCHLVDLGGNNDTVKSQLEMNDEAEEAGVIIVPDCGLAPGMVAVLVADGVNNLDKVDSVKIRVGGLPQSPRPPLNYQMLFSAEGLINEYWEPCLILEDGAKRIVNPMTSVELLEFDGLGKFEAFYTSGGTSTLPETYLGKIDFLDYKTIRYPGHCNLFKPMLDIGLASRKKIKVDGQEVEPRALLKAVLDKNLSYGEPDMTLVRIVVEGETGGEDKIRIYEIVDRQDNVTGLTSMMRMTSFPAAIVCWMAAAGHLTAKGCKPQELLVPPEMFIKQLKKRNINLVIKDS